MSDSITIAFGTPHHGWLPVDFRYENFVLEFEASDVLNDPIGELLDAVINLQDNEPKRITWWLEPAAYFFDLERVGQDVILAIAETEHIHNKEANNQLIFTITADSTRIIEPFRDALKLFFTQTYGNNHWAYKLDDNAIGSL